MSTLNDLMTASKRRRRRTRHRRGDVSLWSRRLDLRILPTNSSPKPSRSSRLSHSTSLSPLSTSPSVSRTRHRLPARLVVPSPTPLSYSPVPPRDSQRKRMIYASDFDGLELVKQITIMKYALYCLILPEATKHLGRLRCRHNSLCLSYTLDASYSLQSTKCLAIPIMSRCPLSVSRSIGLCSHHAGSWQAFPRHRVGRALLRYYERFPLRPCISSL